MPHGKRIFTALALFAAALAGCADQGPHHLSHLGHATRCSLAAGAGSVLHIAYVDGEPGKAAAFVRTAQDGTHFDAPQQLSDPASTQPTRDIALLADAGQTVWALYATAAAAGNGELYARRFDGGKWSPALRIGKPLGRTIGNGAALDGVWSWAAAKDSAGAIHVVWAEDPADHITLTPSAPRAIRHATLTPAGLSKIVTLAESVAKPPAAGWRCLDVTFSSTGMVQVLALNLDTQNVELMTRESTTPILASASYDLAPGRVSIGRRWITAPASSPRFLTSSDGSTHILACLEWTEAERTNLQPANDMPEIIDLPLAPLLAGKNTATLVCETPHASILAGGFWPTRSATKPAILIATGNPNELLAFTQTGTAGGPPAWGDRYTLAQSQVIWADLLDGPAPSRRILTVIQEGDHAWVQLHQY